MINMKIRSKIFLYIIIPTTAVFYLLTSYILKDEEEAKKKVLKQIMPDITSAEVLDAALWNDIAQNVIILEDRTNTTASGGGKTPQYLVVPRRWAEENLSTPEEQAPAATTAAKPAAKPAAKNWGPRRPNAQPSNLDEAADMQ